MLCLRFKNLIYYYHSKKSIRIKMIKNYKKGLTKEKTKYILTVSVDMIQLVQIIQLSRGR